VVNVVNISMPTPPTMASVMPIQTPIASSTNMRASRIAPIVSRPIDAPPSMLLYVLREISACVALFDGDHIARTLSAQHADQLLDHRHEQQQRAQHKARLRNPQRDRNEAVGNVAEVPAVIDENGGGPCEVRNEQRTDDERRDLELSAPAGAEPVEQQRHPHEIATTERVRHREEARGGAKPSDEIVGAAGAQPEFA